MRCRGFNSKFKQIFITFRRCDLVLILAFTYLFIPQRRAIANPQPASLPSSPEASISPADIPETVNISKFEIVGNRVIPEAEIESAIAPFLSRPISFAELLEVQEKITQLYVARGYVTTGAYIPPQTIADRTIRIEIIEGRIGEIEIFGLKKLNPEYIRSRIAIAAEAPLNQEKLFNALQVLQLNPLIAKISAELSDGIDPGENYLKLTIEEADTFEVTLEADNNISTSVGALVGRLALQDINFLGFGDIFRFNYIQTEGTEALEKIEYIAPIGARGTSIRLFHSSNDNQITIDPFPILDLESKNRSYQLGIIQKAIETTNQNLFFALNFEYDRSRFTLMDIGFSDLARGLNDRGEAKTFSLNLLQEYHLRTPNQIFSIFSQFGWGIDAFDATINDGDVPDSEYVLWRGQVRYLKALSDTTNLNLRSVVQFANDPLFDREQFLIGGVDTVRGYNRDILRGDNGFIFTVELQETVWSITEADLNLTIAPFFDFGRIWNSDDFRPETSNIIASLGIATQLSIDDNLEFSLGWGIPLIDDRLPQGNTLQDRGIHFSLRVKPF